MLGVNVCLVSECCYACLVPGFLYLNSTVCTHACAMLGCLESVPKEELDMW